MTMYYSRSEMDYVETLRMTRVMEDAAKGEIDLVLDDDGVHRYKKAGVNRQPDMSDMGEK